MNKIIFGDCRETMRHLVSDGVKVQMCVTSPPYYGLRSYLPEGHADKPSEIGAEQTPEQFISNLVDVFSLVREMLSDDGVLFVNIGDSYYNYRPGAGQALVKQSVASNDQDLPQTCARRGNKQDGLKEKDLIGIPWMLAFALRADGWYLRQDIIWSKPNPMPESVTDRCTKAHEYIFLLSKSQNYYYDNDAIKEKAIYAGDNRGARTDNRRGTECNSMSGITGEFRNKRSVWTVNTKPYSGAHFAVFPEELIEPCILAGSRVGDVVLDCFMGSGTTAQVAQKFGRKYLGCELNPAYEELQNNRTAQQGFAYD